MKLMRDFVVVVLGLVRYYLLFIRKCFVNVVDYQVVFLYFDV